MRAICYTSDQGASLLGGFLHQWHKYCELPVTIFGFTPPGMGDFVSIGSAEEYPVQRWSDGLLRALEMAGAEHVILLLEDYWLSRQVNVRGLALAQAVMREVASAAYFDLSSDRMFTSLEPGARTEIAGVSELDVFESHAAYYRFNLQVHLWRTEHLSALLRPSESPWEAEDNGTARMVARRGLRVLSTYQWPVRYANVSNKRRFDRSGLHQRPVHTLSDADWRELDELGLTPGRHPPGPR